MKRLAAFLLLAALLTVPAQGAQARYLLRERGGAVCVYDAARGAWRDTGCPAASLPRAARAELLRGLAFADADALTRALEAYCS